MSSQEPISGAKMDVISKMVSAAASNNLRLLKRMIECHPVNITKEYDHFKTLLQISIIYKTDKIFTYLLSLECDEESINDALQFTLVNFGVTRTSRSKQYAMDLIKRGAGVDFVDCDGNTFLHLALKKHQIELAQILIEKGADVDATNSDGCTPFHLLFHDKTDSERVMEGVGLLLYYGADASICDNNGYLPFDLAVIYDRHLSETQESLFYYTFDEHSRYNISTEVLLELLDSESRLFFQLVDHVSDVVFDKRVFCSPSVFLKIHRDFLQVVIEKFSDVLSRVFLSKSCFFWYDIQMTPSENWEMLLDSRVASDVVEYIGGIKIEFLIEKLTDDTVQPRRIHDFIFYLLSYGLKVWGKDLDTVYKYYGYCDLFKLLLHMEIRDSTCDIIPRIIYDIHLDLDCFLEDPHNFSLTAFTQLLGYFARPKLRNHHSMFGIEMFLDKARYLPKVPSLVELARDETRKFLVDKFELETSRQFYWLLNRLPVSVYVKRILSFETKLYT